MTAIVGILNKRAAAIAADSAVTVSAGGNTKIYNTSRKIFHLSKTNPVGIMIYSSASFMGTPWDVIIDLYRDRSGDKSFDKVEGYCNDFLEFLRDNEFFSNDENQKWYFLKELCTVYDKLTAAAAAGAKDDIDTIDDPTQEQEDAIYQKHLMDVLKELPELCETSEKANEFQKYPYKRFLEMTKDFWAEFEETYLDEPFSDEERGIWHEVMYKYIISQFFYNHTGLVFIGYGSKDLYPSYHSIMISGIFDGKLRYFEEDHDAISNNNTASIRPFAQDDVMMTMMKGVSPDLYKTVLAEGRSNLESYKEMVLNAITECGVSDNVLAKVKELDIDELQKKYEQSLSDFIDENYVDGLVAAVNSFNIEDMTNMAESLISVTNLQRHFSSSEESVGGPVEVAVITRSGGFKWVKHKQW